ncbi:MAG: lysoplasmalogenase [Clostridia bacterium]|nr:lysoplasmalogenase [Clostridia bacterium]
MIKKAKLITSIVFVVAELAFLCAILFDKQKSLVVDYSAIVLAFLFGTAMSTFDAKTTLTSFALLFTAVADLFLVIWTPLVSWRQSIAMTSFSVTQICYFVRLLLESKTQKTRSFQIIFRIIFVAVVEAVTIVVLKTNVDYLSLISMFYYANLILNVITAFVQFKRSPLLAFGLLCFLLCDTFVGLNVAIGAGYLPIAESSIIYKIAYADFNFAWLFYVPSQTLLALSVCFIKDNSKKKA